MGHRHTGINHFLKDTPTFFFVNPVYKRNGNAEKIRGDKNVNSFVTEQSIYNAQEGKQINLDTIDHSACSIV